VTVKVDSGIKLNLADIILQLSPSPSRFSLQVGLLQYNLFQAHTELYSVAQFTNGCMRCRLDQPRRTGERSDSECFNRVWRDDIGAVQIGVH
jgi:hypothetical protein